MVGAFQGLQGGNDYVSGASPATLDRYALGIRNLLLRHPGEWGLICVADDIARGEQWARLMEEAKADPDFDESDTMPWEKSSKAPPFELVVAPSKSSGTNTCCTLPE